MTNRPSQDDGEMERQDHLSDDELSAYINGEITEPGALVRLRAHLEGCSECQGRLADTRVVVSLLNRMDVPVPPRSFKLDSSMVAPAPVHVDPWIVRIQPALRRLTAIAAVILLVIVTADLLSHERTGGGSKSSSVEVATAPKTTSSMAVAGAQATSSTDNAARDQATAVPAAGALAAPQTSVAGTPVPTAVESPVSSQSQAEPVGSLRQSARSGTSYWRLTEFAIGVVVVWLLFLTVALPRLHLRRNA